MLNKTRDYSIFSSKTVLIAFLIISIFIPALLLGNFKNNSINNYILYENGLSTSEFTKDNYSAILTNEEYGLGSVSIDDMHFNTYVGGVVNHSLNYPLLDDDIFNTFALRFYLESVEFIETISPAIKDNLNGTNIITITVKLNETIQVNYTNPKEGYLIYLSHFLIAQLLEFYVDNGSIIKLTENEDFYIDPLGFIVFYYEDYFDQVSIGDFKMYLIWDYDLALGDWTLDQREETPLIIRESEQEFTSRFTYQFFLIGWSVLPDLSGNSPIDYIDIALTIHPPDKELLTYQDFIINDVEVITTNYLNPDKSISIGISDLFTPNRSFISLNFTYDFGLKFEEPVGKSWAIDRLVAERNIRERIYFISITTGPPHVFLKDVVLYDTGIFSDQVMSGGASSLFGREVLFFDANASSPRQLGLKVIMPYMIFGETSPFTIKYLATQTLNFIVTDAIRMPLVGAFIEILHFGVVYGTYISNKSVQPIDPGITDGNGQVVLHNVPRGNYTVRVMLQGRVVIETTITTDKEINYVFTSVPHFPTWILIFGMVSGIILVIGAIFYLKYKKMR